MKATLHSPAFGRARRRGGWLAGAVRLIVLWIETAKGRRALARLDARLLRDIGIDPYDAAREARRPFWDV